MVENTSSDPRTDSLKRTMAEHFAENEQDYRDADWCSVVYEDEHVVLLADHKGYEFDEWADESGDFDSFSEQMHDLAGQLSNRRWPADYPLVFNKMEN